MPTYDYLCEANGAVLEVVHRMSEQCLTWGELCARLGMDPGATAPDAPVRRLITGGNVMSEATLGSEARVPGIDACCGGGCDLG